MKERNDLEKRKNVSGEMLEDVSDDKRANKAEDYN